MKHIYFFVHRERFHLTIFNKNVTENIRMKIFIQTRVFAIKQKRCNLGSLLLFLKNATHEIQAHRLLLKFCSTSQTAFMYFQIHSYLSMIRCFHQSHTPCRCD